MFFTKKYPKTAITPIILSVKDNGHIYATTSIRRTFSKKENE